MAPCWVGNTFLLLNLSSPVMKMSRVRCECFNLTYLFVNNLPPYSCIGELEPSLEVPAACCEKALAVPRGYRKLAVDAAVSTGDVEAVEEVERGWAAPSWRFRW